MRSSLTEVLVMLCVLVVVAAVVGPIGYAMEGLPSMLWAIGGAIAWVIVFALAARTSSAKMHAQALIGGWLCGTAWALGWLVARGLTDFIGSTDALRQWGMVPALLASPFAGIGGGLLGGIAFGERGTRYGIALGLTWGTLSGVAPYPFIYDRPGIHIALAWALMGTIGASIGLPVGLRMGRALRPVVFVFEDLRPYLSEMAVPFAGFVSGYLALVLLFSGLIGTLWRLDPAAAFAGLPSPASYSDFLYYSVAAATGLPIDVEPLSLVAKLVLGLEAIFAQGWMIAVFAAVGAHLTPRFSRIAEHKKV